MSGINRMLRRPYPYFESLFSAKYEELKTRIEKAKNNDDDGLTPRSFFMPVQPSLTKAENEILWIIFEKGPNDNYYSDPTELFKLTSSNKYSYRDVEQAIRSLQARGYIDTDCKPPGYYLTSTGISFMLSQLKLAFEQGFLKLCSN